jgi:hypothetical protein
VGQKVVGRKKFWLKSTMIVLICTKNTVPIILRNEGLAKISIQVGYDMTHESRADSVTLPCGLRAGQHIGRRLAVNTALTLALLQLRSISLGQSI